MVDQPLPPSPPSVAIAIAMTGGSLEAACAKADDWTQNHTSVYGVWGGTWTRTLADIRDVNREGRHESLANPGQ